jgi:hypothetical protein
MMFRLDDNEMRLLLRFCFKYYIGAAQNKPPRVVYYPWVISYDYAAYSSQPQDITYNM